MTREEFQQKEIERLRPTPKPSSTSRSICGDGGVTPVRVEDQIERRRILAQMKSDQNGVYDEEYWQQAHARYDAEKAAERADEERRIQEQNSRRAANEAAERHELERQQKQAEFKLKERLVEGIFNDAGLTPTERGRVNERLATMGDIHNVDAASVFAQEIVLSRGKEPVESNQPSETRTDWRGLIGGRK
jgi:hypothetical protein